MPFRPAWFLVFGLAVGSSAAALAAGQSGDALAGKAAFAQCAGCHSLAVGANGIGPSLNGVVGRPIASAHGFAYSPAMLAGQGRIWSAASLDAYLANPNAMFPGNKMGISVADAKRRLDIIAYLKTAPAK